MRNINVSVAKTKHGECSFYNGKTKEYRAWRGIKTRCLNIKNHKYKDYGARGITVCDRWLNSFENFLADMGRAPSQRHSIERNEVNGNYEPSNCRWATPKEQSNNTRRNFLVEYNGEIKTLAQWCEQLGLRYFRIYDRIKSGWPIAKAFTQPLRHKKGSIFVRPT